MAVKSKTKIIFLCEMALLVGIMLLMEVTSIGNLNVAFAEITLFPIPVIVGAVCLGPWAGLALGGVFGVLSFFEGLFAKTAFAGALFQFSPVGTAIVCILPRLLAGLFAGLVFKALTKKRPAKYLAYILSSLTCVLTNSVVFLSLLMVVFGKSEYISSFRGDMSVFAFLFAFFAVNVIVESIADTIVGTAASKAVNVYINSKL